MKETHSPERETELEVEMLKAWGDLGIAKQELRAALDELVSSPEHDEKIDGARAKVEKLESAARSASAAYYAYSAIPIRARLFAGLPQ